jgi:thioesterase domain-containing protein
MRKTRFGSAPSPKEVHETDPYARMTKLAQAAFGREVLRKVIDLILPLNDSGTGPAFYCVHSITGAATEFRHMARMLGPQQRSYGIQTPTSKRNAEFAGSIASISQHYIDRLVTFQPEGSFILGGHSVGAIIALEMAQQLRARGRTVDLVVVFDGELFNTGTGVSTQNPLYWLKLIWNLPGWIREFLMVEFTFRKFCRTLLGKAAAARKMIVARLRGAAVSSGHAVEGFINLDNCTPDHAAFMKVLYETQFAYVPREYSGRVLVCVAKTQALMYLRQVAAAWSRIAPASEIVHFRGTHTSIMRPPRGLAVAEHLARQIAEIEPRDGKSAQAPSAIDHVSGLSVRR